jgi:hypothetical protein
MKLLLVNLIIVLALTQGCMPTDKYDTQYTLPARTFVGILLAVPIHFEVRCGSVDTTVVVLDTYGQIAMVSDIISPSESLELEGMVKDHAREVCRQ